jgi:TRAP-type transport system small permease protein
VDAGRWSSGLVARLRRVAGAVLAAADWTAVACLCALVVLTNLQVYYRYVLDNPLAWPEELARNLFIWAVYLGLVKVFRSEGHYRIDVLVRPLPAKLRTAIGLGVDLVALGFFLAVLSEAHRVLMGNWHIKTSVDLPVNLIYASLPVAVLLLVPVLLAAIARHLRVLCRPGGGADA